MISGIGVDLFFAPDPSHGDVLQRRCLPKASIDWNDVDNSRSYNSFLHFDSKLQPSNSPFSLHIMSPSRARILIYLLRRDLRLADNPIFHELARNATAQHRITHLLPIYVFSPNQIETSGFLKAGSGPSSHPFPPARSPIGQFWRTGPFRARFLAESLWDLKGDLERVQSTLVLRVGPPADAVQHVIDELEKGGEGEVFGVWMTAEEGSEEKREERDIARLLSSRQKSFKLWTDEKYFVDDRDLPFKNASELPDVFTTYRKSVEPLREVPRSVLPKPSSLPSLPANIPSERGIYKTPSSLEDLVTTLLAPINDTQILEDPPRMPSSGARSAHPFHGGSSTGHERIKHLISSGHMTSYKDTRNGLLGADFSTKLSAWLALGSITARQVHEALLKFEDGASDADTSFKGAPGFGRGENKGTAAVRFELLWRDYMRLCHRKFGDRLFQMSGFRGAGPHGDEYNWKNPAHHQKTLIRFLQGRTGTGLIDASMRELFLTGYTSNRTRQNVASFLAKHLGIDWRVGAEWYESMLVDYDVSSNWGNWAYVAGVGNDPRGDNGSGRIFNPVKQAADYDPQGEYIKAWVEELRGVRDVQGVWQAWKVPDEERKSLGLQGVEWVEYPLKKIQFNVGRGGAAKGGRHESQGGQNKRRQARGNAKRDHANTHNDKE